jgi:hypothetical protein
MSALFSTWIPAPQVIVNPSGGLANGMAVTIAPPKPTAKGRQVLKSSASSGMGIVDIERDRARSSGIDDGTSFAIAKLSVESKRHAAHTDLAISPHPISFDAARCRSISFDADDFEHPEFPTSMAFLEPSEFTSRSIPLDPARCRRSPCRSIGDRDSKCRCPSCGRPSRRGRRRVILRKCDADVYTRSRN